MHSDNDQQSPRDNPSQSPQSIDKVIDQVDIDMEDGEQIYRPKAKRRLRKVSADSSIDEDQDKHMEDSSSQTINTKSGLKRAMMTIEETNTEKETKYADAASAFKTRLSEEMTAATNKKPINQHPPKMVKVKKTITKMDAKGYMVTEDVEEWQHVDTITPDPQNEKKENLNINLPSKAAELPKNKAVQRQSLGQKIAPK